MYRERYVYMYICICIYIYIYTHRERERDRYALLARKRETVKGDATMKSLKMSLLGGRLSVMFK